MSEASDRLQYVRLKTSYDWLRPEWQNTKSKRVYLYQNLWAKRDLFLEFSEQIELISISTNSGRHHPGCLWIFGGKKLLRRKYLYGENELAVKFHVMWFISLFLLTLLRYPLIYIHMLVVRVLRHILSLTADNYLMIG